MADSDKGLLQRAKRYSSLKYTLGIVEIIFLIVVLLAFVGFGLSKALSSLLYKSTTNRSIIGPLYLFIIFILYYLLSFPLNFYRTYILEHTFCLSNQKVKDWFKDQVKTGIISYSIMFILVGAFYFILQRYPDVWWFVISLFWIFFSLVLAKLVPVAIIPVFFKYRRLTDEVLRERIMNLADKMKVEILDCFEIDFSKKTLKANAAFVGIGKTRRVILADTLKDKYSYDEMEVILAHEFAHYRLKHLLKLILVNSAAIMLTFYLIFKTNDYILDVFGFVSLQDISALPVVFLYFLVFGIIMEPFENYIGRKLERNADRAALKITGLQNAFISMMEKLAAQNLADRNPHPIIKFFFFDHPPIDERIRMAKQL